MSDGLLMAHSSFKTSSAGCYTGRGREFFLQIVYLPRPSRVDAVRGESGWAGPERSPVIELSNLKEDVDFLFWYLMA